MMKSPHASNKIYGSMPRMAGFKNRGYYGFDPDEDYIEMLDDEASTKDEYDKTEKDEYDKDDNDIYVSEETEEAHLAAMFGQNWEYRL